jgi:hypothetical protein
MHVDQFELCIQERRQEFLAGGWFILNMVDDDS